MFDKLKEIWLKKFVLGFIEKTPGLKKLFAMIDGHKTTIGRCIMFIAALLAFLHSKEGIPDFFAAHPAIDAISAKYTALAGWLMTELGLQHQEVKEQIEEEETGESPPDTGA